MNKTILLAVDGERHVRAATGLTGELAGGTGDRVIVLHVHEFAVGRFGRLQVDCPEGEGERLVEEIVSGLKDAGITAAAEIREARTGHIARTILEAAAEHDARMVVLGSGGRTDMPHIPFGSVSHRLLHWARMPVLIVPEQPAAEEASPQRTAEAVTA